MFCGETRAGWRVDPSRSSVPLRRKQMAGRHDRREVEWAGKHEGRDGGWGNAELGTRGVGSQSSVGQDHRMSARRAGWRLARLTARRSSWWLVRSSAGRDRRDEEGGGCRAHRGRVGGRRGRATWGSRAGVRRGRERAHRTGGGAPWFIGWLRSLEGRTTERQNKERQTTLTALIGSRDRRRRRFEFIVCWSCLVRDLYLIPVFGHKPSFLYVAV